MFRATGQLDASDRGVFIHAFLLCICGTWDPRREALLPGGTGSAGCIWPLVHSCGAPAAEAAEQFLPGDTRGSWRGKEEMADGVTGCQTLCGLL